MWPFKKSKKSEPVKDLYSFTPQDDITALECADFLSDSTRFRIITEDYVSNLPDSMKRHFQKISASDCESKQ